MRSSLLSRESERLDDGRELSIWPGMMGKDGLSDWERLLLLLPEGGNEGLMKGRFGKQHNKQGFDEGRTLII